jgi:hypothetical protein
MRAFLPLIGTQEVAQRWPNVAGAAFDAEGFKGAPQRIEHALVEVEIDLLAHTKLAFGLLTLKLERADALDQADLGLAQVRSAAKIRHMAGHDIAIPTRQAELASPWTNMRRPDDTADDLRLGFGAGVASTIVIAHLWPRALFAPGRSRTPLSHRSSTFVPRLFQR